MKEPEIRYWIQDIAPDGGYVDSIGLDNKYHDRLTAEKQLRSWQEAFPERKSRLIVRVDVVVSE